MSMEGQWVLQRKTVKERGREIRIGKENGIEKGKGNGKEEDINHICPYSSSSIPSRLLQSQLLLRLLRSLTDILS